MDPGEDLTRSLNNITPRKWQLEALELWQTSFKGVVSAVTGAGKTTFAFLCIQQTLKKLPETTILIIVPTQALLDQWYWALRDELGIGDSQIATASSNSSWKGKQFIISVINTARRLTKEVSLETDTMIIVDECHRAGSPKNASALEGKFVATLGLSATPERQYDEGFNLLIRPVLGDIIYAYDYVQALKDGVIVPFDLINIRFALTSSEQKAYDQITKRIAILRANNETSSNLIERLLIKRARISWNSPLRVPLAAKLVLQYKSQHSIIFHESIAEGDKLCALLLSRGVQVVNYHNKLDDVRRRENLRLYKSNTAKCMVCCRSLDEGFNVPFASLAVIASSTSSIRQRIQRLGRVLRKHDLKSNARIYTLYATDAEEKRLTSEASKLEGLASVTWLTADITNGKTNRK